MITAVPWSHDFAVNSLNLVRPIIILGISGLGYATLPDAGRGMS